LRRQFEVNVFGPIALVKRNLSLLRSAGGRVVFMGAGQGRVALPFGGPYGASKAALASLTDALRAELYDSGVKVSLIEPGAVQTPILERSRTQAEAEIGSMPTEGQERYAERIRRVFERSERVFQSALPPERVAAVVLRALTARDPKPRYLVGREAYLLALIAQWPARLRERLVVRFGDS
jgi:NAD(P)-dependent dehydrogenase (short-subunit alcohol dehydrogenase family)